VARADEDNWFFHLTSFLTIRQQRTQNRFSSIRRACAHTMIYSRRAPIWLERRTR
jgi:hypothetical protein